MGRNMEALRLYKTMMRESQKFASYNFRNYALRRIRDGFKENKGLENPEVIEEHMKEAIRNLNLIKRQVIVGNMYQTHKLVIEMPNPAKAST